MPHTVVTEKAEQQLVHLQIKLMETRAVIGAERAFLLAQVFFERCEECGPRARRDGTRSFGFEGAANEHRLPAIGQIDARDACAALRPYLDEAFRRQPTQCF